MSFWPKIVSCCVAVHLRIAHPLYLGRGGMKGFITHFVLISYFSIKNKFCVVQIHDFFIEKRLRAI